ncbi:MAG TPA: hypothetical protein VE594_07300 [Nitrososphaeraceae archaeon]|nr:hypothetical protein [Nitrososphaeraceae archaeon]
MKLGQKLFEEVGKISGIKVVKVHPLEGVTMEISFMSDIKGIGKYPSGKNLASGTITKYPHGIIDGSWQGTLTTELGEQFMWWSHEKSKVIESDKIKGLNITTGFTNSQELSWMNNLIIVIEISGSVISDEFSAIGYEWIC